MGVAIKKITALEVLDSRGNPTVRATVELESGASGTATVPSGASVGKFEAHELRDGDKSRYGGMGVSKAVGSVEKIISPALCGMDATNQRAVDLAMLRLDGTKNKSSLGANAILAVSMAVCRAAASELGLPLYRYIGGSMKASLPTPMLNILNGGAHASNNLEIQEFMIVPHLGDSFAEKMRIASEVYKKLGSILRSRGYSTSVGDEGGYAPSLESDEMACELIISAIEEAGYTTDGVKLALDVASSGWYENGIYRMPKSGRICSADELTDYYVRLVDKYPIVSIEDGLGEEDFSSWRELTDRLGGEIMLVGDDLFVTNEERVRRGIDTGVANSVLIKPNQIGTVTETAEVIALASREGYSTIVSHRSGDSEDSFIADLAVGMGTPYIKSGAPTRSERLSKYNRLIEIEKELANG